MRVKRTNPWTLVLRAAASLLAAVALAREAPANPAWEKLKSLTGDWEGTAEGHPAKVSYKLVSSGTALAESLSTPDGGEMLTIYHPDGSRLVMTHYCSENNQPRMRAAGLSPDGKRIVFTFVDVTNVSGPDAPHMVGLVVLFLDADHVTQQWTHQEAPGKTHTSDFQFTRKK
jgi:WD40-like Beta Propeller Repeat